MNSITFGLTPRAKSEAELIADGWTRRFVGGPPRLNEMLQMYKELGFEIWLEPQTPDEFSEDCADCTLALMLFRVIYTRPVQQ